MKLSEDKLVTDYPLCLDLFSIVIFILKKIYIKIFIVLNIKQIISFVITVSVVSIENTTYDITYGIDTKMINIK